VEAGELQMELSPILMGLMGSYGDFNGINGTYPLVI